MDKETEVRNQKLGIRSYYTNLLSQSKKLSGLKSKVLILLLTEHISNLDNVVIC